MWDRDPRLRKGRVGVTIILTKRKLYEFFLFERGWIAKSNSSGSYSGIYYYKWIRNDDENSDMADWPTGSQTLPICSWSCFSSVWASKCPIIKVRPPSRDICTDCFIFKNMSKFNTIRKDLGRYEDDDIDE